MIEVPGYHVAHDPEIFPDPYKFDGLRFHRLREQAESFNKPKVAGGKTSAVESAAHNLFVSVSPNSLLFGYGRHACPGRFFAANEIKMIVARAVLTYDMRNAGDSQERYNQWYIGDSVRPDPSLADRYVLLTVTCSVSRTR
jgi:cytochrome P450